MSHIICLMNVEEKRATFTWSEGPAAFEPYTLDGMDYIQFKKSTETARGKLADLIKDYLYAEDNVPKATFDLAKAGHNLHEALFCPGNREAKQVRKWLEILSRENAVDTVEIVVDSPWSLPWNVIYDRKPKKDEFLSDDASPDRWKPFWGLKYNMCGGRKVDPLRRMPILRDPHVLVVIDPQIRDGLPSEQQTRLAVFADTHNVTLVNTKDDLEEAIEDQRPDLLYWMSHASPEALMLSDEPVSPWDLLQLLRRDADDEVRFGGLAFLNACQTAEVAGEEGSFFEAFHKAGFAGMIGTEHQTIDQFANPLGLDFLEAFLDRGESVGEVLQQLRRRVPLGLLYGTYCPPDIRVEQGKHEDTYKIKQLPRVEGVALGVAPQPTASLVVPPPLPPEPYPSLAFYERKDRALFAGRDDDVERFATLLDDAATRILVLHGESGVGKSSFLNAGVIPFLEEECYGYRFLSSRGKTGEDSGAVIFVRATNDMFGQLAQALCDFCAQPYEYQTPLGETVSADLPGVLREFVGGITSQAILRGILRDDRAALGQLLAAISDCLPFAAVLVIDQGEEVFTLAKSDDDLQRGRDALDMLRRTTQATGDFKVIFSLRTEYYGRVIDRLRRGLHDTRSVREYLLTDFGEQALIDAIKRPTSARPIPHAADVPFEKYGFCYAEGVSEALAQRVIRYTTQRSDSILPLVQVICTQLYALAAHRADKTITLADLATLGGIEGGMRSHVNGLLDRLVERHAEDKRPLQILFTQLYLRQPDGTLTTALLPEEDMRKRWTGQQPFEPLLQAACDVRLLKVNSLRIGFEEEHRYVSLGHDALAKIAADWDEALSRGDRMRKVAAVVSAVAAVAVVMAFLAGVAWRAKQLADRNLRSTLTSIDRYYKRVSDEQLLNQPGMQELRTELLADAVNDYRRILAVRQRGKNATKIREELADTYYRAGRIAYLIDSPKDAVTYLEKALKLRRVLMLTAPGNELYMRALGDTHTEYGNALFKREEEKVDEADYAPALRQHTHAIEVRERLAARNRGDVELHRKLANAHMNLGSDYMEIGVAGRRVASLFKDAQLQIEKAQQLRREQLGRGNLQFAAELMLRRDLAEGHYNLTRLWKAYADELDVEAARKARATAADEARRSAAEFSRLEETNPSIEHRHQLALTLALLGDIAVQVCDNAATNEESLRANGEAIDAYDRAEQVLTLLVQRNPAVRTFRMDLANLFIARGDFSFGYGTADQAKHFYRQAYDTSLKLLERDPDDLLYRAYVGSSLSNVAVCYAESSDWSTACDLANQAIGYLEAVATSSPDDGQARERLEDCRRLIAECANH